jgi:hypothetical protein
MGETAHPVDLQSWRLSTRGAVKSPKDFTYNELLAGPVLEINVLLECPEFFAYNGWWKCFSIALTSSLFLPFAFSRTVVV